MGNFNRGGGRRSFGGGGRGFGDRGGFRGRSDRGDRGDRQMFKTVCSNCGKDCEVPFKPTGDKPVYCSDCFEKMGGRDDRKPSREPRNDGRLDEVNAKLDKILSLLEAKE